ncbi:hypothetical protein V9T40_001366 [Parthenolecanium corni]|uniref:Uncharacterized protein n=1 Tax=Parthenolecanium corni TaxID=536013 RepID=A0AAN9Y1C8_9HEMI
MSFNSFVSSIDDNYQLLDEDVPPRFSGDMEAFINSSNDDLKCISSINLSDSEVERKSSDNLALNATFECVESKENDVQLKESVEQSKENTEQSTKIPDQSKKNPEQTIENPEQSNGNNEQPKEIAEESTKSAALSKTFTEAAKSVEDQLKETQPTGYETENLQQRLDSIKLHLNRSIGGCIEKFKIENGGKLADLFSVEENLETAEKRKTYCISTTSAVQVESKTSGIQSTQSDLPERYNENQLSSQKCIDEKQEAKQLCPECKKNLKKSKLQSVPDQRPKVVIELVYELTKKVYQIKTPFTEGEEENDQTAYQFLKQFEFVFSSLADDDLQKSLCFRQLLSSGLDTDWVDFEPYDTPYVKLRQMFLWRHFSRSIQREIYEEFKKTNFEKSIFENCADYVGYWVSKFQGIEMAEESLVSTFVKNLPEMLQRIVEERNPKTLIALKQIIYDLPMDLIVLASTRK